MLQAGAATDALYEEDAPERIGAYRIVSRIGRGGMGSVYRGERETGDFLHVTAIKIIKPGLLSESLVERFERERQTLASLRSEEHTSELQSLMRNSYAVFCLKKKKKTKQIEQ